MQAFKAKLQQLADRIDAFSLRERAFLLLAVIMVIFTAWDKLLLAPLDATGRQYAAQISKLEKDIAKLHEQQGLILARTGTDPDKSTREALAALQARLARVDAQLQKMTVDLIDPRNMAKLLEQVLTRETGLQLIRVEALASGPLRQQAGQDESDGDAAVRDTVKAAEPGIAGVYRHSFLVEFEGGYLETLKYLRALEALPWLLYWHSVDFTVSEYPVARVRIIVNTLSLNDSWIGT
jgi:MSHA biogenesis protein MshJ